MEGDRAFSTVMRRWMLFQSTPSAWRVTAVPTGQGSGAGISIHTLRVEGDYAVLFTDDTDGRISIHTLRVEGDVMVTGAPYTNEYISIHTLRVEGDYLTAFCASCRA